MLTLNKIYKSEFNEDFARDFLDPHYKGEKYLFGTNDLAAQIATRLDITGFINTRDKSLKSFMQKPVLHDPTSLRPSALVLSCVHLAAAAADILLSALSFRHLSCFEFSILLKNSQNGGGGGASHINANFPAMVHFEGFGEDIVANLARYERIYELLGDELSRHQFLNLLNFKHSGDSRYIRGFKLLQDEQYFEDFLRLPPKPVFVDAGGYTGDTALKFIEHYKDFGKIFIFEPESQNLAQAKRNLSAHENIIFFQKGLSDKAQTLKFSSNASASAIDENGELSIEVARLDDLLGGERVDFIKMDIEGAEGAAIAGASECIKRHHPTLAICVYHKKDDFYKIPEQILALRDDYKLYFRHYTQGTDESVMFFLPR